MHFSEIKGNGKDAKSTVNGLYLPYIGLLPMMKAPADKQTLYFIVSLVITIVVSAVLSFVFAATLLKNSYFGF